MKLFFFQKDNIPKNRPSSLSPSIFSSGVSDAAQSVDANFLGRL